MSSQNDKLLGVIIDHKLRFNIYWDNLCKLAKRKLQALAKATPCMFLLKKHAFNPLMPGVFFLSRRFTIHMKAGEGGMRGGSYLFESSLLLPPILQTLRH